MAVIHTDTHTHTHTNTHKHSVPMKRWTGEVIKTNNEREVCPLFENTLSHTKDIITTTHTHRFIIKCLDGSCVGVCVCVCEFEVCAEFRAFNLIPFFIGLKQQGRWGNTQCVCVCVCVYVCVRDFVAEEEWKIWVFRGELSRRRKKRRRRWRRKKKIEERSFKSSW